MRLEFRFRLNGEIMPELFIQRALLQGGASWRYGVSLDIRSLRFSIPACGIVDAVFAGAAIGRKGGQIGGKRRLKTMTEAERSKVAARAARARWRRSKKTG
jgi:hypothetical protein